MSDLRFCAYQYLQIFIGLNQVFEGETVRPLDGAHPDVSEASLA